MKSFKSFVLEEVASGMYIGMKLHPDSAATLAHIATVHGIPNPLTKTDLHTTIMYSKNKKLDDYEDDNSRCCSAKISGIDKFDNNSALVLKLDSPDLQNRNKELSDAGLEHSFDPFVPHITLSYGATDYDAAGLEYLKGTEIKFNGEYGQPVIKDWGKNR